MLYNDETVVQRLDRREFYYANQSRLTKPSTLNPAYLYENQKLFVKPTSITNKIKVDYVRKPNNIIWGFDIGTLGQYVWNETPFDANNQQTGSVNFELHHSEQTEIILKILLYSGIIIRDPQIVQAAAAQVQADEVNKKS